MSQQNMKKDWVKNDSKGKEYNLVLQSHIGEQNSSTDGPPRGKGGALGRTCVTFHRRKRYRST